VTVKKALALLDIIVYAVPVVLLAWALLAPLRKLEASR